MRQNGRIVSVAVIVAVGVKSDGRREVLGMDIGPSEAEAFWTAFPRKLARRRLRGVKLVVSDAHEGVKTHRGQGAQRQLAACRVHFMRNVLAHAGRAVGASSPPSLPQRSPRTTPRLRERSGGRSPTNSPKLPKLAGFLDEAEIGSFTGPAAASGLKPHRRFPCLDLRTFHFSRPLFP